MSREPAAEREGSIQSAQPRVEVVEEQASRQQEAPSEIGTDEALQIVRKIVEDKVGEDAFVDYQVGESPEGYKVFVQYGSGRDERGAVTGFFPGGHTMYILSKRGEILKVIPGA